MRLALLVLLASTAAFAQQQPPSDPTPPPIDRSVPNSGTSRTTDDAAKPTERDGSLVGSSGSSSPAPLGPNDPKAPSILNGKESTSMPRPKIEPGDTKPDR
jgi:hypothetical protein